MRIIAGELGGRRLVAPRGTATRPTSERVREALFSMLGELGGARVLDLYAGSGALGLEALSRGATLGVLVESSRTALAALRKNVASLGLGDECRVVASAVERASAALRSLGPFSLVLVDPPYALVADGTVPRLLDELLAAGIAEPGASLVLEHASRDAPPTLAGADLERTRRYGDTAVTVYRVGPAPKTRP